MTGTHPLIYRTARQEYLTPKAFGQHFGVSYMTVLRLVHLGAVQGHRVGQSIRIPASEIARYTEATRMDPYAEESP